MLLYSNDFTDTTLVASSVSSRAVRFNSLSLATHAHRWTIVLKNTRDIVSQWSVRLQRAHMAAPIYSIFCALDSSICDGSATKHSFFYLKISNAICCDFIRRVREREKERRERSAAPCVTNCCSCFLFRLH
jgi:hypothetical protein